MNSTISNVKIDSIIYFIIHKQDVKPLVILFNDYIKKKYSKKRYLLIKFLIEAYSINNFYENTPIYTFIEHFVKTYPNLLIKIYMWN